MEKEYLGDGVYAFVEHGTVWIETPRESGMHQIALEPEVLLALYGYVARYVIEIEART